MDITADWCVTCKANKQFILNDPQITSLLTDTTLVAMQGDWTRQDEKITTFLQQYARYGIPFNAVFGPLKPEGIILPELLSQDEILRALKEAGFHRNSIGNKSQ